MQFVRHQPQEPFATSTVSARRDQSPGAHRRKEVSVVRRGNILVLLRRLLLPPRFAVETSQIFAALAFGEPRQSYDYARHAAATLLVFPERLPLATASMPR